MGDIENKKLILGSSSKWRREQMEQMGYVFETRSADIDEYAITVDGNLDTRSTSDPHKLTLAIAHAKADAILPQCSPNSLLITSGTQTQAVSSRREGKSLLRTQTTHTLAHTHTDTHKRKRTRTHSHTQTHSPHPHTHTHTDTHKRTLTLTHKRTLAHTHTPTQTHTPTHTRTHTQTHVCASFLIGTTDQVVHYKGTIREKPETAEQCKEYLRSYVSEPATTVTAIVVTDVDSGKRYEATDEASQVFKPIPEEVMDAVIDGGKGYVMKCCGGFMIDEPRFQPYLGPRKGTEDSILGMPEHTLSLLLTQAGYARNAK